MAAVSAAIHHIPHGTSPKAKPHSKNREAHPHPTHAEALPTVSATGSAHKQAPKKPKVPKSPKSQPTDESVGSTTSSKSSIDSTDAYSTKTATEDSRESKDHAQPHAHFLVEGDADDHGAGDKGREVGEPGRADSCEGKDVKGDDVVAGHGWANRMTKMLKNLHGESITLEVKAQSPQVAVLWGSVEHNNLPALLERHDMTMPVWIELPENDRFLFVVERSKNFLEHNHCGSVASELEALRLAFCRATALQRTHQKVEYWEWPLQDAHFNRQLLLKSLTADGVQHVELNWRNCWTEIPLRISTFLGLRFGNGDLLAIVQSHFGSDVALTFLFTFHYIMMLWLLGFFCLIFHILKNNLSSDDYRRVWSPIFQFFVLFPWSLFFIVKWRARVQECSKTWMADMLDEDVEVDPEINPDFYAWNAEEDPTYYPNWLRAVRTLAVVPIFVLDLMLMAIVLSVVFWAEMYIVFEWGDCAALNAENRNTECLGADTKHGFLGGLAEAGPGLVEGLLFEILLAISKALARYAVRLQNWRTRTQQNLAYIVQLIFFEFIGKFGWIGVLATIFVPDWVQVTKADDFRYDQATCSEQAMDFWDTRFLKLFSAGDQSLSCLKTRTKYETRLVLFETAVAAPFFVAQIVSMAIKTLVPSLVVRFRACYPNDHGAKFGCRFRPCRALLRCLSCMCLFDTESTGTDECDYLAKGDRIGEEIFLLCCDPEAAKVRCSQNKVESEADTAREPSEMGVGGGAEADDGSDRASTVDQNGRVIAVPEHVSRASVSRLGQLMTVWAEGIREAFIPLDENVETSMHFFWVTTFAAFYPLGVVLALTVYVFDIRGDLFRLTILQKKPFRQPPQATLVMLSYVMKSAVYASIFFNVVAVFITYQQMSRWSDNRKYKKNRGLLNYGWELCLGMSLLTLILGAVTATVMKCFHAGDATRMSMNKGHQRDEIPEEEKFHRNQPVKNLFKLGKRVGSYMRRSKASRMEAADLLSADGNHGVGKSADAHHTDLVILDTE